MPYPQKNLNANETVALDMHPHWWYFAEPAGALLASIVLGIVILVVGPDGNAGDVLRYLILALIVVTAIWLVIRYLKWVTTHMVITSDRLIFRTGIIAKNGIEIPLDRVNNVNFSQGIFERILGSGDLLIESGGEEGQSRYTDVRKPDQVQNLINAQIQRRTDRRMGGPVSGPAGVDVAEQLERLEGMLERGTLTQDEFDAQKRKLLDL
jgi:uncharacterized membrane protein YdbT with pleckstrin-like domain